MKPLHYLFFIWLLFSTYITSAQHVMQIETRGQIEAKKFYEGDELSVKLNTEKFWRHSIILAIDVENNIIDFDFGRATLDEIAQIKTPRQRVRGKRYRRSMLLTGASFALFTPLELIYQDDPNYNLIAGGIGIGVLGVLIKPIIDIISTHRMGKRKQLRLLDLRLE